MDEIIRRHDWWERREGVDLWSVPHFLFGVGTAFAPFFTPFNMSTVFAFTAVVAIVWEVFERVVMRVKESIRNGIMDVFFSILAFQLTSTYLLSHTFSPMVTWALAAAVLLLYAGMIILGWLAHKRRGSSTR
jgi:hypothetical protein